MPHVVHSILVAGRVLLNAHEHAIPIAAFRVFIAEIEQLDRDTATELRANAERLDDERNKWGYSTRLGQP